METLPNPSTYLDIRKLEEVVARVLLFHFSLAFQVRTPYGSLSELRAQPSRFQDDHGTGAPDLAQVSGDTFAWYRFDKRPDDGIFIVRPDDVVPEDAGRWVKQKLPHYAACGAPRFFQWIEFVDGRLSIEELWDRCRGRTPSLFISCHGDELENVSQTRAYHFYEARYRLRVLSANFRGGLGARFGSPESTEKVEDPGAAKMLGWLRWYLISENKLGKTVGISEVELGGRTPDSSRAVERVISDYIDITVRGSVHTPNEPCDVIVPEQIWMQFQDSHEVNIGDPVQIPMRH